MFPILCNEIKYLIIKFSIFSDTKDVLRLRSVDPYFKFVVDEELFSILSNSVERVSIYGRKYFSDVLQKIGDLLWCPRTNQVQTKPTNLYQNIDLIEIDLSSLSTRIYFGFSVKIANLKGEMTKLEFFDQIQKIFHPNDEYKERLKFTYQQWDALNNKNHKNYYKFPISTLDWSFRLIHAHHLDLDFCTRDRFCGDSLNYLIPNMQKIASDFPPPTHHIFSDNDLFTSHIRDQQMKLTKYSTIYDYYPQFRLPQDNTRNP